MSRIRLLPGETDLPCAPGQTLLEAIEDGGVVWPNDCRAGHCGTCKTRVCSGEVDRGLYMPMALSDDEIEDGYCLPCVATPLGDTVDLVRPAPDGVAGPLDRMVPPRRHLPCMVVDKLPRTPEIVELRLRPTESPLRYWPGQYVELQPDRPGAVARPYSIANAPRPDGELSLHVSLVADGAVSDWVHNRLRPGEIVRVSGPYGTFVGDLEIRGPVLCLAGGSGLAPILALTDAALQRGYQDPVQLVFSARTPEDVYAEGLINYWRYRYSNFSFDRTITQPGDRDVPRPVGRIDSVLRTLVGELGEHAVFIAGSTGFVETCRAEVARLGADPSRVHVETYFPRGRSDDVAS